MKPKVKKFLIISIVVLLVGSVIFVAADNFLKWNSERKRLRSVQGIITDLEIRKYRFVEDTYFFKIVSFNIENEWTLRFEESQVMIPVIGKFGEYYQNVEIGDYILVWYKKSVFWDNQVTEYVIIEKDIDWWGKDYFEEENK